MLNKSTKTLIAEKEKRFEIEIDVQEIMFHDPHKLIKFTILYLSSVKSV